MKRKKNDRKYYILILVAVVVTLSVGYALFADVLNISGTFTASGNFDLEFTSASVGSSSQAGTPTATISGDKNTLTLAAPTLLKPGATVTYDVTVSNVGNVDALLTNIAVTGNNDTDIQVDIAPAITNGQTIAASGTFDFEITVTWKLASETGNKTVNYSVTLDYEQAP